MKYHAVAAVIVSFAAQSAISQQGYTTEDVPRIEQLLPLEEYFSRPLGEQVPHYPFQRCAGLFLGYKYYAGATFDANTRQQNEATTENLGIAASFIELNRLAERRDVDLGALSDAESNDVIAKSALQVQGFAFFYDDRMNANYLSSGAAFSEDTLIVGDLEVCGPIAQAALEIVAAQRGSSR